MSDETAEAQRDQIIGGLPPAIHASAVVVGETGILICGRSGAGKSGLALSLLALAAQAGQFARLVGDDRVELAGRNGRLLARGHRLVQGMIERRGQGIIRLAHEPATVIGLVVELMPAAELARFPDVADRQAELCGVKLQRLALLSDRSSYDCAHLIMAYLQHAETN